MHNQAPKISVVIPCLNEADSIPIIIPHLINCLKNWTNLGDAFEIIVVDDNSTDNSFELLKKYPEVKTLQNEERLGYGGALKKGFQTAQGQYLTFFDLDRTYDPVDLEKLFNLLITNDLSIVFGNRMAEHNQMPFTRHLGNAIYAKIIQVLYRTKISDVCTGMRIFKKEILKEITNLPEDGLNFSIAFTVVVLNKKYRFSQLPIKYHERIGSSKLSVVSDGLLFLFTIFRYYSRRVR